MFSQDFKELLTLLNDNDVEYLIVGGYAVALYGYPRFTGDLDVWIRNTPINVERLLKALEEFGFSSLNLSPADFLTPNIVVQLGFPPNRIDILVSIDGVSFEDAVKNRNAVEIDGLSIPLISKQDLLTNKSSTGRLKDRVDIENLPE